MTHKKGRKIVARRSMAKKKETKCRVLLIDNSPRKFASKLIGLGIDEYNSKISSQLPRGDLSNIVEFDSLSAQEFGKRSAGKLSENTKLLI